jgi:hypothetical protein
MERVVGMPIKKKMALCMESIAAEQGKTVKELTDEYAETFKDPAKLKEFMNAPPPSEFATNCGILYLTSRDYVRNSVALVYKVCTLWGILGAPIDYKWTSTPVNGPAVTKLLYEVHGHQIFHDGKFNADPHAGNVMCGDDGRLALIDYGNAPNLGMSYRRKIAKLIIALDEGTDDEIVDAYIECGAVSKHMNRQFLLTSAFCDLDNCYGNGEIYKRCGLPEDMTIAEHMDWMLKIDAVEEFTGDMMNIMRCAMTLNGVGSLTGAGATRPRKMWNKQAKACLAQEYTPT